jgi:hypothetical protein
MATRPPINVEDELAAAIVPIGGFRVTDRLGRVPGHENADFFFPSANVIAELKCLDEDKINDDKIINKASDLYIEELNKGRAPSIVFGTVNMTTRGFSAEFTEKIAALYQIPIERQVRKAERQIAVTKQALSCMDAGGLLMVANNNHSALDPWHACCLVGAIMKKPEFLSINSAVLFAGKLGAVLPGREERIDYWIEFHRLGAEPITPNFLTDLRVAWFQHLGNLFGTDIATIGPSDLATLARLESR